MAIDVDNYEGIDTEEDELKKRPANYGPPAPDSPDITAPLPAGGIQPVSTPGPPPPIEGTPGAEYAPVESNRPAEPPLPSRPQYQPPDKPSLGKRIAVGMAAFGNPQLGAEAAHRVFEEPKQEAMQKYQAATGQYNTEFQQGLEQRREIRERNKEESEAKLRGAQAGQFERVPVTLPNGQIAYIQQKDVEKLLGTETTAAAGQKKVETQGQTARDVANKKVENQRHNVKVMGDGTYEELEPGKWTKIGSAPPRTEPGNYAPIYDPDSGDFAGWVNPKSQHFIGANEVGAPGGGAGITPAKPTGQAESRREQAKVVSRAADGLIKTIQANKDAVGDVNAIIQSAFLGTPLADKRLSGIATEIASFAALQPALHGFRGQDALREFIKFIGGVPKDADALIASIQAIKKTAGYFTPPKKTPNAPGGNELTPAAPKTAAEYLDKLKQKGAPH